MPDTQKLERLLQFIQEQTGAQQIEALDFRQLSGGAVQENHGLSVRMSGGSMPGERHFVVRSDAPVGLSVSLGRAEEFEILKAACAAGVQAPHPYWFCPDTRIMGGYFYIMEWAQGSAHARDLVKEDALSIEQRQGLMFQLGRNLAQLHRITYRPDVLSFLKPPTEDAASQRIRECLELLNQFGEPHPAIELGLWHLSHHLPAAQKRVLCHCDFRTGNYLVANGALTAILDWEFAAWSDPYEDLGWMCARSWRFGHPDREAGGVGDKADLFAGYESISGESVDTARLAYWELMANVRWAVLALEQSHRHRSGQQVSLELALTGRMLPEIQQDLMRHLRDFLATSHSRTAIHDDSSSWHLPTVADRPDDPRVDHPDGAALLKTARSVLLSQLIPALPPEQQYNARMIASAMSLAMREHAHGSTVRDAQQQAIQAYYQDQGMGKSAAGVVDLAHDIREGRFTPAQQSSLFALVDHLLRLKLMLSNPKRLGHA